MVGLVIKKLPEELHRRLKEQAARHHHSMAKEAIDRRVTIRLPGRLSADIQRTWRLRAGFKRHQRQS